MQANRTKERGVAVLLGIVVLFLATTLTLYSCLAALDDQDLLRDSNDWKRNMVSLAQKMETNIKKVVKKEIRAAVAPRSNAKANNNKQLRTSSTTKKESTGAKKRPNVLTHRQKFDRDHPEDVARTRKAVEALRIDIPSTTPCPEDPPQGYPQQWSLVELLDHWNPDNVTIPSTIYNGLCTIDYSTEADKADRWRAAEVPFVLSNHPQVWQAAERWNAPGYLSKMIGPAPHRNEFAKQNNHFMFWRPGQTQHAPKDWEEPTEFVDLPFDQWYEKALHMDAHPQVVDADRWYFRFNGNVGDELYDELRIFDPVYNATLFMAEPEEQRGINCRFGMKGTIAECHFDPTRNWIVVMRGQRRYILSDPTQCSHLNLYPFAHPSQRHSKVNWSDPNEYRDGLAQAQANEVVLQAGDALYLPTYWFHFIVTLNTNFQCNARSGMTLEYKDVVMNQCGL